MMFENQEDYRQYSTIYRYYTRYFILYNLSIYNNTLLIYIYIININIININNTVLLTV